MEEEIKGTFTQGQALFLVLLGITLQARNASFQRDSFQGYENALDVLVIISLFFKHDGNPSKMMDEIFSLKDLTPSSENIPQRNQLRAVVSKVCEFLKELSEAERNSITSSCDDEFVEQLLSMDII